MITMDMVVSEVRTKGEFIAQAGQRRAVEISTYVTMWGTAGEIHVGFPHNGDIPKVGETVRITIDRVPQ